MRIFYEWNEELSFDDLHKRYHHYRKNVNSERFNNKKDELFRAGLSLPNGFTAITECVLEKKLKNEYRPIIATYAFCSSKDQFWKKLGRKIALGRAKSIFLNNNM